MVRRMMFHGLLAVVLGAGAAKAGGIAGENDERPFADVQLYRTFDVPRYEKNFVASLQDPLPMIVESALAQVTMLRLAQPHASFEAIHREVGRLARNSTVLSVRYKAYLADVAFGNPDLFAGEENGTYRSGDELFAALARRLQNTALAVQ